MKMGRAGKPHPVFLYGALLNPGQLADILGRGGEGPGIEAANCYPARLAEEKCISLSKASDKWCAAATLRDPGEDCCRCAGPATGVLCMATEDSMEALTAREGVGRGHYEIVKVKVEMLIPGMEGKVIEAKAFKATPQRTMTCREAAEKCRDSDDLKRYIDVIAEGICYWATKAGGNYPCSYLKALCNGELEKMLADEVKRRCRVECS